MEKMENKRIKKYREKKESEGYKQVNFYLKIKDIEKLKIIKETTKENYSQILEKIIEKINVTSNNKKKKVRNYRGFNDL